MGRESVTNFWMDQTSATFWLSVLNRVDKKQMQIIAIRLRAKSCKVAVASRLVVKTLCQLLLIAIFFCSAAKTEFSLAAIFRDASS